MPINETQHDPPPIPEALGQSDAFLAFQERLSRVARVDRPVLLIGERGTGKELASRRLHFLSARWQEAFVELNCAALSSTLIESELFGHEAGAFSGAMGRRTGRFEAAHGGTLFLDELGNIPLETQEKILRVVEYGVFERVGASASIAVDARIVGATNADLVHAAGEGRFMRDLLDRLSFEVLFLPPLRERREDILLLATHFAGHMALELGRAEWPEFTPEVAAQLEAYPWPGNVRELKNVVERAVYRADGPRIDTLTFDPFQSPYAPITRPQHTADAAPPVFAPTGPEDALDHWLVQQQEMPQYKEVVHEAERALLRHALRRTGHNQREAARILGLTYDQFRGQYRKHRKALGARE